MIFDDEITLTNAVWQDEFDYEPIAQEQQRTVTGGLVTWEQAQPVGETMTITGVWLSRAQLEAMQAKRLQVNQAHTVELDDGRKFAVIFSRPAITATPIDGPFTVPSPNDKYDVILHLQIISPINDEPEEP